MRIAFGYQMGVGKDTACDHLIKQHGGQKLSLSKPLYDIQRYAQERCNLPTQKDRQLLQFLGTNWLKRCDPEALVKLLLFESAKYPANTNIFVSDLRLVEQFKSLRENGFYLIKIIRPNTDPKRKGTGSTNHQSEVELDSIPNENWNLVLNNTGSLKDFQLQLNNLIKTLS